MSPEPDAFTFVGDGRIPNSRLPVLVYHGLELARDPVGGESGALSRIWDI